MTPVELLVLVWCDKELQKTTKNFQRIQWNKVHCFVWAKNYLILIKMEDVKTVDFQKNNTVESKLIF